MKFYARTYEKYIKYIVQPTPDLDPQMEVNTFSNWRNLFKLNNLFTPVWLTIPLSIATALTQLLMIMIIAVRVLC